MIAGKRMLPKERVAAALSGKKPDRLPIMVANSNTFICQYYGLTVEQFLTDADLCAQGNIDFTEEFGIDYNLCVNGYILYGCGPELGCRWRFADPDFPGFMAGPLQSPKDLPQIKVPSAPSGYFAHYLEVIGKVNEALGDRYHLSVSILGPFAVGCFLRGIQEALMDTLANPDFLKRYMEVCTELSIYFGRQILGTGLKTPILNEIFLSPSMIGPETFNNLIAPYDRLVQEALGPENAPNSLAAFMGRPRDPRSRKAGAGLYKAFFSGVSSVAELAEVLSLKMDGMPLPVAVSGLKLDSGSGPEIIEYLRPKLDFMVKEKGLYPSILLASVQAPSKEKAREMAGKILMIRKMRDEYQL